MSNTLTLLVWKADAVACVVRKADTMARVVRRTFAVTGMARRTPNSDCRSRQEQGRGRIGTMTRGERYERTGQGRGAGRAQGRGAGKAVALRRKQLLMVKAHYG